jgi:hypothetical protein
LDPFYFQGKKEENQASAEKRGVFIVRVTSTQNTKNKQKKI